MDVGVDEAGHDRRAAQIHLPTAGGQQRPHLRVAAHGQKAVARDRHRRSLRLLRVHRVNVAVEKHLIRLHATLPL